MKSMNFDKMFKKLETSHILGAIAVVVLIWALMNYSNNKGTSNFTSDNTTTTLASANNAVSKPISSNQSSMPVTTANELLPKDNSSDWEQVQPSSGLQNVNLLNTNQRYGINTVGTSLRNANMQLRSDPPNPQVQVSPWIQSTINPDTNRKPFEIGGCA